MLGSKAKGITYSATAADVTATTVVFITPEAQPTGYMVTVRTSAGAAVAWDGAVALGDGTITVDNTGAVDWADTDVINVLFW